MGLHYKPIEYNKMLLMININISNKVRWDLVWTHPPQTDLLLKLFLSLKGHTEPHLSAKHIRCHQENTKHYIYLQEIL